MGIGNAYHCSIDVSGTKLLLSLRLRAMNLGLAARSPWGCGMITELSKASALSCQPLALHLVEEISHRVVNEYAEAIAILALAASRGSTTAQSALTQAAERLRAHADSHRALLAPRPRGQSISVNTSLSSVAVYLARPLRKGHPIKPLDGGNMDRRRSRLAGLLDCLRACPARVRHGLKAGRGL